LIGVRIDDPRTTFAGHRFAFQRTSNDESTAGSPLQVLLIVTSLLVLLTRKSDRQSLYYGLSVAAGFLFFSGYLQWQPWNARLHLPLIALAAPIVARSLSIERRGFRLQAALAFTLAVCALPALLRNPQRMIVGRRTIFKVPRAQQYFAVVPPWYRDYSSAAKVIADTRCYRIGFVSNEDDWEYPLWPLLETRLGRRPVITHVGVTNVSQSLSSAHASDGVCAIIQIDQSETGERTRVPMAFVPVWESGVVRVFQRRGS
jgi:hypothetical protein